jgi:hypothetical protein
MTPATSGRLPILGGPRLGVRLDEDATRRFARV